MSDQIDSRFIKQIQGRDFVVFEGVLSVAHQEGLCLVDTEVRQFPSTENGHTAVVKAVVKTDKGRFTGTGDANPGNVTGKIAPHIIRMAETRAVARALRFACNIGMCSLEEMDDLNTHNSHKDEPGSPRREKKTSDENGRVAEQQKKAIVNLLRQIGINEDQVESIIKERYGVTLDDLSYGQKANIIQKLSAEAREKRAA